jgi:adenylosuccinate lyase
MTETMKRIIDGLVVNEPQIRKNLGLTRGLLSSGRVLLALVEWGMSREEAYAIVQDNAMRCWDAVRAGDSSGSLLSMLESDPRVAGFIAANPGRLGEMFDVGFYLRYVDDIFKRFSIFNDKMKKTQ